VITERLPSYDDLPIHPAAPPHSAWGLWGPDDQLGCLNLLSDERVLAVAGELASGRVFSLNSNLSGFDPPLFGRAQLIHEVASVNYGRGRDDILSSFNTQCSSQWDGFRHVRNETYGFWNGLPEELLSISSWAERGIVGRGVILDVERYWRHEGRVFRYDKPDPIETADLVGVMRYQGVSIETGDILIVHTGWTDWARQLPQPGVPLKFATPGLKPSRSMLAFLWNLHIAAVASDTPSVEVWPPGAFTTHEERVAAKDDPAAMVDTYMHGEVLPLLGLPLGELWDTGQLARYCASAGRWTCLITAAPNNLSGGAGSPSNALAIV
jgi:kynurenine formamidase